MPWVDRGVVNCIAGENTVLISVQRISFRMAARAVNYPAASVQYLGVMRWMEPLTGIIPAIAGERRVLSFWNNPTIVDLNGQQQLGWISFYALEDGPNPQPLRVFEFVP